MGGGGGAQCPVWRVNDPKKMGVRSTWACKRCQNLLVVSKKDVFKVWTAIIL
jgi:hypothetical protein